MDKGIYSGRGRFVPGSSQRSTQRILSTWNPNDKLEDPSQALTFLGIDSTDRLVRLPEEKLWSLRELTKKRSAIKKCKKHELSSVIGSLSFACRIFLRRLIASTVSELHHHIESREDISTWETLLATCNGVSVVQSAPTFASSVNCLQMLLIWVIWWKCVCHGLVRFMHFLSSCYRRCFV